MVASTVRNIGVGVRDVPGRFSDPGVGATDPSTIVVSAKIPLVEGLDERKNSQPKKYYFSYFNIFL